MKRILDSYGGVTEIFHQDDHDKSKFHIQVVQDVASHLRNVKAQRDMHGETWRGELHKVAEIPRVLIEQWNAELGDYCLKKEYRNWLIAKLNSNEFEKLRTKEGKI